MPKSNFLPLPPKRANPLPNLPTQLLSYIGQHFRDAHPEAFRKDVDALVKLRKEFVEPKAEAHPAVISGLQRFVALRVATLTLQVLRPAGFPRYEVPIQCQFI